MLEEKRWNQNKMTSSEIGNDWKFFRVLKFVSMLEKRHFPNIAVKMIFLSKIHVSLLACSKMAKKSKKVPYLAQFTRKCGILQARNSLKDSIAFLENILCEAFLMLVCASITKKYAYGTVLQYFYPHVDSLFITTNSTYFQSVPSRSTFSISSLLLFRLRYPFFLGWMDFIVV